jgi:hypothetical protein
MKSRVFVVSLNIPNIRALCVNMSSFGAMEIRYRLLFDI